MTNTPQTLCHESICSSTARIMLERLIHDENNLLTKLTSHALALAKPTADQARKDKTSSTIRETLDAMNLMRQQIMGLFATPSESAPSLDENAFDELLRWALQKPCSYIQTSFAILRNAEEARASQLNRTQQQFVLRAVIGSTLTLISNKCADESDRAISINITSNEISLIDRSGLAGKPNERHQILNQAIEASCDVRSLRALKNFKITTSINDRDVALKISY